jgi:hypothetical protein
MVIKKQGKWFEKAGEKCITNKKKWGIRRRRERMRCSVFCSDCPLAVPLIVFLSSSVISSKARNPLPPGQPWKISP